MASRSQRAEIARQTVSILEQGAYTLPAGGEVSIRDRLAQAVRRSELIAPDDVPAIRETRDRRLQSLPDPRELRVRVESATTLAAARELVGRLGEVVPVLLNFASAKNPGGGFLGGSQAQEESLARASGLYACINPIQRYYEANRACGSCLYTDHMIYSPGVPVFRDDHDALLAEPYCVAMITAPAVNAGAVARNEPDRLPEIQATMLRRIEQLLSVAVVRGHRAIVLGAWGCGVFRNDPALVAEWFYEQLIAGAAFRGWFEEAVFAIYDRTKDEQVLRPFAERFAG